MPQDPLRPPPAPLSRVPRRAGAFQEPDYPTAWWQKGVAAINSVEELFTKAIGSALTGDPKYDQPIGDFYRQVGFHDLFKDAGVDPKLAVALGITAAIANPLDPFNLAAIGKLSKVGAVRKLALQAKTAGTLENVVVGGKTIQRINPAAIKTNLASLKSRLAAAEARTVSGAGDAAVRKKATRFLRKQIKDSERRLVDIDTQNDILRNLQIDKGMDIDEITNIPSTIEQIRSGERSLLGFTSPLTTAHIPFKSVGPLQDTAVLSVPGIGKGRLAAAIAGIGASAGSKIGDSARKILNGTVRAFQTDEAAKLRPAVLERAMKDMLEELKLVVGEVGGETNQFLAAAENILVRYSGLPKAEQLKVVADLENRFPVDVGNLRALQDQIQNAPADVVQARIAKNVREVAEENDLGVLTREQQLDINPSRLGQLDVNQAMDAWDNSAVEAVRIRGGHSYILTEDFVITKLGGRFRRSSLEKLKADFETPQTARMPALTTPKVVVREGKITPPAWLDQAPGVKAKWLAGEIGDKEAVDRILKEFQPTDRAGTEVIDNIGIPGGIFPKLDAAVDKAFDARKGTELSHKEALDFAEKEALADLVAARKARTGGTERFLVARKIAAGQPITPETLRASHLENMGRGVAQLAPRGALVDVAEESVLISPFGGVQMLQPEAFLKNQTKGNAAVRSEGDALIRDLAGRNAISPDSLNLGMLSTSAAARKVKSKNFGYVNSIIDADLGIQKGDVGHIDVKFLMDAENMGGIRQLIRGELPENLDEFLNANNIQGRLAELQEARQLGERPSMRPIQYMIGNDGKIFIVDGQDRLAAAAIDGLSAVPVFRKPFLGEVLEDTGAFYSPYGLRGADVLRTSKTKAATGDLLSEATGATTARPELIGVLDDSYRLLSPSGRAVGPLKGALIRGPAQNRRASEVIERLGNFATVQPGKNPKVVRLNQQTFARTLTAAYGDREIAALRIADIADQSSDILDFEGRLIADLQARGSRTQKLFIDLGNPGLEAHKSAELAELQEAASEFLDGLARDRVFTANSLDARRAAIASEALGGTVIGQVADGLLAVNANKTLAETADTFKQFVSRTTDPSNVHHLDQVAVVGSDGQKVMQFGDLVGKVHPRINRAIPLPIRLAITPEMKLELANKKIYHIAPDEKLGLLESDSLNILQSENGAVWFKTRSGDTFVRPGDATPDVRLSVDSVTKMLVDTFGEASSAVRLQEFGFLMRDKLVISNPLGGMMQVLDPANVKIMETRLRETAQQFIDMGLNSGVRMDVVSQFDPGIWKQIYNARKRFPTVGDVAKKTFKLEIPDGLAGKAVDIDLNAPFVATRINRLDMSEPAKEISDWLQSVLDDAIRREVKAGLPIGFFADYFPRFMPQGTRDALNRAWESVIGKIPRVKRTLLQSSRLLQRRFTDLGTQEINAIFKNADIDMSDIIASAASAEQAALLTKMSDAIDGTFDFFHADPIVSTVIRQIESFKIKAERAVLDSIEVGRKSGLLFRGTPKALARVGTRNKRLAKLEGDRLALKETISETERTIQELAPQGEEARDAVAKLTADLEKAVKKEEDVATELNALTKESFDDHLIAKEVSDDPQRVWVSGSAARKMLDNGALSETNMLSHPSADMVQVQFTDSLKALNESAETEVLLMTPELEEVMTRLFGLKQNRAGQFGNLLRTHDAMLGLWKQWTLFPIPAFHIRNTFSDLFLMTLGRGLSKKALGTAWDHLSLLRRFRTGSVGWQEAFDLMEVNKLAASSGDTKSMSELWNAFIGQGGSQGQFVWNEFNRSARFTGPINDFAKIADRHGIEGASSLVDGSLPTKLTAPLAPGKKLQETRETWLRFSIFLDEWQNTGDFTAAGNKMKTILYDYSNLTSFERNTIRRIVPFYSWMRFNIPRMMQTLATEPVFHARMQAALRNIELDLNGNAPIDENDLPEWLQKTGLVWSKNKDGTYNVKSLEGLLPVYDLVPLITESPVGLVAQNVSPLLKLPFEQLLNKSAFTGRDLAEVPGEPARSATLARLGATRRATAFNGTLPLLNLLWNEKNIQDLWRFGKQITQTFDFLTNESNFRGEIDVDKASFYTEMSLGRMYRIDPQTTAYYARRNDEAVHRTLQSLAKRALRQRNMPAYHVFTRRLTQLRLTRPPQ